MKKIITVLMVCMLVGNINVSAVNFTDVTKKLVSHFNVQVTDDLSGISKLQNRKNLTNPKLISAAIKSGVVVARNGLIDEDGKDFTPLTDGIIKRYINDDNYIFVAGTIDELKKKNIKLDSSAFYITENGKNTDISSEELCTCVADKNGKVIFAWKSGDVVSPALYKVKLYWAESGEIIVTNIYRKEYALWIDETTDSFRTLDGTQVGITKEFVMENLDKYIYVFADNYGGNIRVKGISK